MGTGLKPWGGGLASLLSLSKAPLCLAGLQDMPETLTPLSGVLDSFAGGGQTRALPPACTSLLCPNTRHPGALDFSKTEKPQGKGQAPRAWAQQGPAGRGGQV